MATIKKKDLIDRITETRKQRRTVVRDIIQDFLTQMAEELERGNRLEFRDFGVFEVRARAPRTAQNPRTLERVLVPARSAVRFKAGRLLREKTERTVATKVPEAGGISHDGVRENGKLPKAISPEIKVRAKRPGAAVA